MSTITLPPTVNALDSVQRTRLRRSTRKLGDVLGTTPRLVDPIPLPSRLSTSGTSTDRKPAALYFPHDVATSIAEYRFSELVTPPGSTAAVQSSSPVSGLPTVHKKQRQKQSVHPLVLCLWSTPATGTPSLSTSHSLIPHSPSLESIQDRTDLDEADKFRRRKQIAKLTRTLGANIPPELVFPHHRKYPSEPPSPSPSRSTLHSASPVLPNLRTHRSRSMLISSPAAAHDLKSLDRPSTSETSSGGSARFSSSQVTESQAGGWSGQWSISDPGHRALVLRNLKGK